MKLKHIAVVAALALSAVSTASFAACDGTVSWSDDGAGGYTGGFCQIKTNGSFTDTITIDSILGSSISGLTFDSTGQVGATANIKSGSGVTFSSITLNGAAFTNNNLASGASWSLADVDLTGPLTLVIQGTATKTASYSGTLSLSPVPEPESYALMAAGLAALAFVVRRRSV